MSDASDASDAVSTPSTVFSRVAASAAWKRLNRLRPALAAAVILLMGFMLIAVTPAGHIPDVWAGFLALIPWHSAVSESTAVPSAADAARA